MSKWVLAVWGLCVWFSIAMIGYGVALQRYSSDGIRRLESSSAEQPDSRGQGHEGRISQITPVPGGARLKIEGLDQEFEIPIDEASQRLLREGTRLRIRVLGPEVTEVLLNPGTPFQRNLLKVDRTGGFARARAERLYSIGKVFVFAGVLLALVPVLHGWLDRRRRSAADPGKNLRD